MDDKHIQELAYYIFDQLNVETTDDMPLIFDDYTQARLTKEVMAFKEKHNN